MRGWGSDCSRVRLNMAVHRRHVIRPPAVTRYFSGFSISQVYALYFYGATLEQYGTGLTGREAKRRGKVSAAQRRLHPGSDLQRLHIGAAPADKLDANRQSGLAAGSVRHDAPRLRHRQRHAG